MFVDEFCNEAVRRARQQIETALNLMRAVYYEKLAEIAADAKFSEEIHRHPLNLDLFMKSVEAADVARGSFGTGYAPGSVSHR